VLKLFLPARLFCPVMLRAASYLCVFQMPASQSRRRAGGERRRPSYPTGKSGVYLISDV
jgi:hypothetical protein